MVRCWTTAGVLLLGIVGCGTEPEELPLPPPPGNLMFPNPYVAPSDTIVRSGDSLRFRVRNTPTVDSLWRWSVSDTAVADIGERSGAAHTRLLGKTQVRACTEHPSGPICYTTSLTVQ